MELATPSVQDVLTSGTSSYPVDNITNATLRKLIIEDILDEFATATGYGWDADWRDITMVGSGQIGRDGYTVSVDIERLTSCDVCYCKYDCTGDDPANYLCDECGNEHLEWLDIIDGVTKSVPVGYRKYANVTVTGRNNGVDLVFRTASHWLGSEAALLDFFQMSGISLDVAETLAECVLLSSPYNPDELASANAPSWNEFVAGYHSLWVSANVKTVGIEDGIQVKLCDFEITQEDLPEGHAECILDVLDWRDEDGSVVPALKSVLMFLEKDVLTIGFEHFCTKCISLNVGGN
jgi:hypothetical protein